MMYLMTYTGSTINFGVSAVFGVILGSLLTLISIIFGSALTMKTDYYQLDEKGFFSALRCALADMHLLPAQKKS